MSQTVYSARFAGPSLIEQGKDSTVSVAIERDGAAATITAVSFSLYEPGGNALVDGSVGSVSGGTLTSPTISASATSAKGLDRNWLVRFDATIGGVVEAFYNDAALVKAPLYPPIGQTDLIARHHDIAKLRPTDAASLQPQIDQAWADLISRLYQDGIPFWRLRTPSSLRLPLMWHALEIIFRDYGTLLDAENKYDALADKYEGMYELARGRIQSTIDSGEENILERDLKGSVSVIQLSGLARTAPRRWP